MTRPVWKVQKKAGRIIWSLGDTYTRSSPASFELHSECEVKDWTGMLPVLEDTISIEEEYN